MPTYVRLRCYLPDSNYYTIWLKLNADFFNVSAFLYTLRQGYEFGCGAKLIVETVSQSPPDAGIPVNTLSEAIDFMKEVRKGKSF